MQTNKNYKKLDTKTLIQACIDKDALAWAEFISRFSPIAFRAIRKRLENHKFQFSKEDIEDLRQGFFTKLWQEGSLKKVINSLNINYWICMVAANFATDFYRRSRKDVLNNAVSIFEDVVLNNKSISIKNFIKTDFPSARKKIEKKDLQQKIDYILSELSPKEKLIAEFNIFHNKKYWEISKILKLSIGNVASILKRSKAKIKKKLQ